MNGRNKLVDYFISKGCNQTLLDDMGENLLHVACMGGNAGIVDHILSQGILQIDSSGYRGKTPVMRAALCGQIKIVLTCVTCE